MSSFSANADIPICIDTSYVQTISEVDQSPEDIYPKCSASSREQPIHCISVSPAPPPYHTVTPPNCISGRLEVPSLNVQTSAQWLRPVQPLRPAPSFRSDGGRESRVRFRLNSLSPSSPHISEKDIDSSRSSQIGLGIPDAPFKPDISPITSGTAEKADRTQTRKNRPGDLFGATNFAQRIEQKLWKYNASRNVVKRWLMEIISWIVSALCMAGIIAVLVIFQQQPLPRWPLGLTFNAYISVLAKIASAALLIPVSEALGQLKWNWFKSKSHSKEPKKMWDFEGATVTIFALAMDHFFQQVVIFPEQWRLQSTKGYIPRAITYKIYAAGIFVKNGNNVSEVDQSLSAVAYHYFYDNGTSPVTGSSSIRTGPGVPLNCSHSRCAWDQYESLGVCNRCSQNTDLLEFRCQYSALDWIPNPTLMPDDSSWIYPNGTACGWYLKADVPILMTGYTTDLHVDTTGEDLLSRSQPLYDLNTRASIPGYTAKLNNTRNPISHFVVVSGKDVAQVRQNSTPIAHECIISWCVRTLHSNLSAGLFTENVTDTVYNNTFGPDPWLTYDVFQDGKSIGLGYSYGENVKIIGNSGHEYEVDNITHTNILGLFDDIFPSSYTVANTTDLAQAALRFPQYVSGHRLRILTYNPFLYENITIHLDNLIADFTNIMRSAKGSIDMVEGPAFDLVSVVVVRWEWLSLPLALLCFTAIFLVATIIRNSIERDVGVWKNSAIAVLLYGLPDDVRKKITSVKDKGSPRTNAKHTKLKWLPGTGLTLSGARALSPSSLKSNHTPPQTEWK